MTALETALARACAAGTADGAACTDSMAPEALDGVWHDRMTAEECETLALTEQIECEEAYRRAFLRAFDARPAACICGPDHDCRAPGCDLDCPACR